MKKTLIIVSAIVLALVAIYFFFFREVRGTDETFLIPEGTTGCFGIYYDQKDSKPLTKTNNKIIYKFPQNGKLMTSSPQNFGWARMDDSGWHDATFYYVNNKGEKIKKISHEKIGYEYTSEYSDSSGDTIQSYTFYISKEKNKFPDSVECENK
ncbi:hypothetical protein O0Q50_21860 [Priestia aryabhattai]|uniref:DUF6843 domain-containing protein n=1 Tax=Priestia aryabhattai TaxID=412384 RepID=A0AAX6ND58_PRIAR|nr:hypothetical protein [Priestia aryabhattai]MDU9693828.1 hypothetical protein [Priestia aryabhattai]